MDSELSSSENLEPSVLPNEATDTLPRSSLAAAQASVVLGFFGLFTCITAIPGFFLAIKSIVALRKDRPRDQWWAWVGLILCGLAPITTCLILYNGFSHAIERKLTRSRMIQIGEAVNRYVDAEGHYPPQAIYSDTEKPLLSWRVLILPYLNDQGKELYQKFHLNEAWDSPHNRQLLTEMPGVYQWPGDWFLPHQHKTCFLVPQGKGVLLSRSKEVHPQEIQDGRENTILLMEVNQTHAVPWTQPADWVFIEEEPLNGLAASRKDGFYVLFADLNYSTFDDDIDPKKLKAWTTINGREPYVVPRED
ncbi:Hypothetical protein PBC10988_8090 [Planctomycetales bacterium 10988]|nr:Hypothetical protein PBC10988_8090 [Planctomycetales bacterium 10988]